jgi:type II secretory pathway pseudopilin PulG
MPLHPLKSSAGFTYIAALTIVMIMGIMMGVAGQSWKMIMDREREEELLWVGTQYRDAMLRWRNFRHGGGAMPLGDLKHLTQDPRSLQNVKHLRRLYPDPITGKEWRVIKDPQKGILGIASSSEKEPIKQANFPADFTQFEGKKKYSEWEFRWDVTAPKKGTTGGVSGIPTTSNPAKPSNGL